MASLIDPDDLSDASTAATLWYMDNGAKVLKHLTRHLICLQWVDALKEPRSNTGDYNRDYDVTPRLATCFALSVRQRVFLITAGHVLDAIEHVTSGDRRIVKALLRDGLHGASDESQPFDLESAIRFKVHDQEHGVDYGAIHVRSLFAHALLAVGTAPLDEESWASNEEQVPMALLLGFPAEHCSLQVTRVDSETSFVHARFGTPLIPLIPTSDPPDCLKKEYDRFYAKILALDGELNGEELLLSRIEGMSGGPVFGLYEEDGHYHYRLIGVQSSWASDSKVIAACPIEPFADMIAAALDRIDHEARTHSDE